LSRAALACSCPPFPRLLDTRVRRAVPGRCWFGAELDDRGPTRPHPGHRPRRCPPRRRGLFDPSADSRGARFARVPDSQWGPIAAIGTRQQRKSNETRTRPVIAELIRKPPFGHWWFTMGDAGKPGLGRKNQTWRWRVGTRRRPTFGQACRRATNSAVAKSSCWKKPPNTGPTVGGHLAGAVFKGPPSLLQCLHNAG